MAGVGVLYLGGGALAVFGLKWIYAASFLASMASLGVMLKMTEPAPVAGAQASLQATVAGVIKKSWTRRFRFFYAFQPDHDCTAQFSL